MNGFLLIDKSEDWSSRDVCNKVQHVLSCKKVGHTGTLDPFATGLLLVSMGNGTKAGTFLEEFDKEYEATLVLGKKTSTGDKNGDVLKEVSIPELNEEMVVATLNSLLGKQKQIPPMTSAIHYKGQKLYKLAHQGIEVEREPRDIEIFALELLEFNPSYIRFKCHVSKGTYVRVLGETIAEKLGTVGYLSTLRRTAVGPYRIENSVKLEEVTEDKIFSIREILEKHMPTWTVFKNNQKRITDGAPMRIDNIDEKCDKILIVDEECNALAVYKRSEGDIFVCARGLW